MKSKKITICLIFLAVFLFKNSFAQNTTNNKIIPDQRLYQCFDSSYVQRLLDGDKEGVIYYNYLLEHSYFISKNDLSKPTTDALDIYKVKKNDINKSGKTEFFKEDLSSFNPKTFNVLMYVFASDFNKYTTYKLGNTGKLLIFYPKNVFIQMYNEYKKSIGY